MNKLKEAIQTFCRRQTIQSINNSSTVPGSIRLERGSFFFLRLACGRIVGVGAFLGNEPQACS